MKSDLLMDFVVDKAGNRIKVKREFAAPVSSVWRAWTEKELLDQWWAPKPWKAKTKEMDFREGGHWLYAMLGPEGEEMWSRADFLTVRPKQSFEGLDAFCDAEGKINKDFPQAKWLVEFHDSGDSTIVHIEIKYDKPEDLEKYIEMGFKEGFTMGMENLDELIAAGKI
jgi:uncharacterized protein YndB with AHSA1/START domain